MQQLIKKIPVFILLSLHFAFLAATIIDNKHDPISIFILTGISVLLGFFYYKKVKADRSFFKKIDILLVFFTAAGALITYYLNVEFKLGVVLAAGITGLISSALPYLNRRSDLLRELPVAIYCGAFAGMTAPFIAQGYLFIAAAGLFSGLILIISKNTLHGFGGKLGTIAFGGVSIIALILFLFS